MTPVAGLTVAMSEKDWQTEVIEIAGLGGWRHYHTHDSRRSPGGFPDLVFVRPGEIIFAELKSESGKVRPDQQEWLELLASAGQEVYLWRPSDRREVERVLLRPRRPVS